MDDSGGRKSNFGRSIIAMIPGPFYSLYAIPMVSRVPYIVDFEKQYTFVQ